MGGKRFRSTSQSMAITLLSGHPRSFQCLSKAVAATLGHSCQDVAKLETVFCYSATGNRMAGRNLHYARSRINRETRRPQLGENSECNSRRRKIAGRLREVSARTLSSIVLLTGATPG